ncbi:MAG: hypothetical protein JWO84_40 [Parcubacteria group bacterium]|nr:hypothetical protein [Parcubacteria group bacterium]
MRLVDLAGAMMIFQENEAVYEGARLLDDVKPGWADRIDREMLAHTDVLTQLYGGYQKGMSALNLCPEEGLELGFRIENGWLEWLCNSASKVKAAWVNEIVARQVTSHAEVRAA